MELLPNDNSRPLILVGSNSNLEKYIELCDQLDITIDGIVDSDYYKNTDKLFDIPVIDTEDNLNFYKETHNFFCATNWIPESSNVAIRNKEKRIKYALLLLKDDFLPHVS